MAARILLICGLLLSLGCIQMPSRGTRAFIDMRAGDFWTGDGLLLEVSQDQQRCFVAVRDRTWLVQKRWVDCAHVHATSIDRDASRRPIETF